MGLLDNYFWNKEKRKLDYEQSLQKDLNAQQQAYAVENADVQYQRTKEMAFNSATYNKLGMQAAGISTAGLSSGGETPSVSMAQASGGGSAPQSNYSPSQVLNSIISQVDNIAEGIAGLPSLLRGRQAETDLKRSQTTAQNISNLTLGAQNNAIIDKMVSEKLLTDEEARKFKIENDFLLDTYKDRQEKQKQETVQSQLDTQIKQFSVKKAELDVQAQDLANQLTDKQIQIAQKDLDSYSTRFMADVRQKLSSAKMYDAQSVNLQFDNMLKESDRYKTELESKLIEAKIPSAKKIAQLQVEQETQKLSVMKEAALQAVEQTKQKKFETEHQKTAFIWEHINQSISSLAGVAGAAAGVKLVKSVAGKANQQQQQQQQQQPQQQQEGYAPEPFN